MKSSQELKKQLRQIVTAVSDGAAAAQQAEHYLGKMSRTSCKSFLGKCAHCCHEIKKSESS